MQIETNKVAVFSDINQSIIKGTGLAFFPWSSKKLQAKIFHLSGGGVGAQWAMIRGGQKKISFFYWAKSPYLGSNE